MNPQTEFVPDALVSHYRLVSKLGSGGMGEVWVGVDETLRRRVAMKAIRTDRRLDQTATARFLREARILSQLDHPNICRVYDYIDGPRGAWLVMELIDGVTLRTAIAGGMSAATRLGIASAIVRVLAAMHAAGVVHRDLKPTNVMLTPAGDPKVLDFGLSAVESQPDAAREVVTPGSGESTTPIDLGDTGFHSQPGSILGTLAYMSPEQLAGEAATTASDMYAFGLLLEEMYTARAPSGTQPYPRDVPQPPPVPKPIAALIARLTATVPAQRPAAVDALAALEAVADAPRRLRLRLAIAAVVIAIAGGAAKYTVDLSRERSAALAARDEADRRRQQAESLIGFMVGDLRTRLTSVGRLDLLDEVGKRSLDYFNAVPASTLTGEELFRRSQTLHQLGQVRQARGDTKAAFAAYQESLALAQRVADSDPQRADWQLGLGTSHFYVGDLHRRNGDLEEARRHFAAYQSIAAQLVARDPNRIEWKLELSYGYSNMAAIYSSQRKFEAARQQLLLTRDIQSEIAKARPDDRTIQTSRANNFNRLGIVLQRLGDLDAAINSFRQELAIYRELAAKDPRNTQFRRRIPVASNFLGQSLRAAGEPAAALEAFQQAAAAGRELLAIEAANTEWQRELAMTLVLIGRASVDDGAAAAGVKHLEEARRILTAIAENRNVERNFQVDLPVALTGLADALAALGQHAAAVQHSDRAVQLLEARHQAQGSDPTVTRVLAAALNTRGRLHESQRNRAGAVASWTRAAELMAPLQPNASEFNILEPYARALLHLGRHDEAADAVARLEALGYRDREFESFVKKHAGPTR